MEFEIKEMDELTGAKAHVYSIIPEGASQTLLEQFFEENKVYKEDLEKVLNKIQVMAHYTGCRKIFFKEGEGAFADGVVALRSTGCLRLYGIYFNETLVLFGSGGHKPPTVRSYQQHPPLNAKAQQMRIIAKEINRRILTGELKIEEDGQLIEL